MVAEWVMLGVAILATSAELLHLRRVRRLSSLAFGPERGATLLGRVSPALRILSLSAVGWGLTTLLFTDPKIHRGSEPLAEERQHLILVLDVSPSMRLRDAGPTRERGRMERVADLLESLFARAPMSQFRISIVAVYNGAKPVVIDTTDGEVVWNVLRELPMHYAFPVGKTRLFDGLEEAAKIAHPWPPRSASLLFISDGDTVPATDTPRLPASIATSLVVGVGDPKAGSFIEGRQSRQDVSTLRQIAARLKGTYHDGNDKQIPSELLKSLVPASDESLLERLTRREYALIALGVGSTLYGVLPWLLHLFGSRWSPGVPIRGRGRISGTRTSFSGQKKRAVSRRQEVTVR